jgi:hypothetical protein
MDVETPPPTPFAARSQRAFAGVSDRGVGSSAIYWLHHPAVYPLPRAAHLAMALTKGRYCDIALAVTILPYSTGNVPTPTAALLRNRKNP